MNLLIVLGAMHSWTSSPLHLAIFRLITYDLKALMYYFLRCMAFVQEIEAKALFCILLIKAIFLKAFLSRQTSKVTSKNFRHDRLSHTRCHFLNVYFETSFSICIFMTRSFIFMSFLYLQYIASHFRISCFLLLSKSLCN